MESLANKYRPRYFQDVVGQKHIIDILQNQLKSNNFKQGYLFTGGAGTGKTTNARIFAREIDGEVIEIDAASNNGVDNVREIRDKVKYKPMGKKYKVYIIDEVHMLSTGAFNALLKTLEEPPPHAVFILCTTDPQKIPATILSRVQRYDFKRITHHEIVDRLKYIVNAESERIDPENAHAADVFDIEPEVYDYIAKLADGGMRDAISVLDTCLGYKDSLTLQDVFDILGTAPVTDYIEIIHHLYSGDTLQLVQKLEDVHISGKDLKQFVKGMAAFTVDLRKLLLFKNMDFVMVPLIYEEDMKQLVNHINHKASVYDELDKLFKAFTKLLTAIKYEHSPKVLVQGVLLSLCL